MIKLNGSLGDNFCIAPWVNLHIQTTGEIKPCCGGGGNENGYFGLAQNKDWSYINGTSIELESLKSNLLANRPTEYCAGCQEKPWYSSFLNEGVQISAVNDFVLKSIDLRWSNTCQLSCLYCNSGSSSTWQKLENKARKRIPITSRPYQQSFENLFNFLDKSGSAITRFSMLGGEPLLMKENIRLLDILPTDAAGEIFTNLNVDLEHNYIYHKLLQRDKMTWYISMENVGKRFEFVRRGARWDQQLSNLRKIKQQLQDQDNPGHAIYLQSQFCAYSALHLSELYEMAESLSIEINWAVLTWPTHLNFFDFPCSLKMKSIEQIELCQKKYATTNSLQDIKQKLINTLDQTQPGILQQCRQWHQDLSVEYFNDHPEDFESLWPEYQQDSP